MWPAAHPSPSRSLTPRYTEPRSRVAPFESVTTPPGLRDGVPLAPFGSRKRENRSLGRRWPQRSSWKTTGTETARPSGGSARGSAAEDLRNRTEARAASSSTLCPEERATVACASVPSAVSDKRSSTVPVQPRRRARGGYTWWDAMPERSASRKRRRAAALWVAATSGPGAAALVSAAREGERCGGVGGVGGGPAARAPAPAGVAAGGGGGSDSPSVAARSGAATSRWAGDWEAMRHEGAGSRACTLAGRAAAGAQGSLGSSSTRYSAGSLGSPARRSSAGSPGRAASPKNPKRAA